MFGKQCILFFQCRVVLFLTLGRLSGSALSADEEATRVAMFFQPIRVDEASIVIIRILHNINEEWIVGWLHGVD